MPCRRPKRAHRAKDCGYARWRGRVGGSPRITTLRPLGAQWNRLQLLCPNLTEHCAQSRLFGTADIPV
jgi:hypothetical protein